MCLLSEKQSQFLFLCFSFLRNDFEKSLSAFQVSKSTPLSAISTAARHAKQKFENEFEEEKSTALATRHSDPVLEYPGRYDENELTVAVVHALASVTSTTSCAILVVAGLVSCCCCCDFVVAVVILLLLWLLLLLLLTRNFNLIAI